MARKVNYSKVEKVETVKFEAVDYIKERADMVRIEMKDFLTELSKEKQLQLNEKTGKFEVDKYKNLDMRIYTKINSILRKGYILSFDDVSNRLSAYVLKQYFDEFIDLIDWVNEFNVVLVPTKQLFSAFIGMAANYYNFLLEQSNNQDIINTMKFIEDYILDMNFISAQNGISVTKPTMSRAKIKDFGHNLKENNQIDINTTTVNIDYTPHELTTRLSSIMSGKLENKK